MVYPKLTATPAQGSKDNCSYEKSISAAAFGKASDWLLGAVLVAAFVLYYRVIRFDFVNYDDPGWISANPVIQGGLSLRGIEYAFRAVINGTWNPLAVLSLMLDTSVFGPLPGMMHLINLWLHLINVVIVFLFAKKISSDDITASFAALLFAIHPANVESVCWISDRKGLLACTFTLLTLTAYLKTRQSPSQSGSGWTFLFYVLALLSKPTAMAIPFLLLAIDVWPLRRIVSLASMIKAVQQKWVFILLAIIEAAIIVRAESNEAGRVVSFDIVSLSDRVSNAIISLTRYLGHLAWPTRLNVCYYYRLWSLPQVIVSLGLISVLFWMALRWRARFPYLIFGLLFFVGGLLPALQLVHLGHVGMADRYQYLPSIGIFIAVSSFFREILYRGKLVMYGGLAFIAAIVCLLCATDHQIDTWRNSGTLFERAVKVMPNNPIAHLNLALFRSFNEDHLPALEHARLASRLFRYSYPTAVISVNVFVRAGEYREAYEELKQYAKMFPNNDGILQQLVWLSSILPNIDPEAKPAAIILANRIVDAQPGNPGAYDLLATALAANGLFEKAVETIDRGLKIEAYANLEIRQQLLIHKRMYRQKRPEHLGKGQNSVLNLTK